MKKQELIDKINNGNYHCVWEAEDNIPTECACVETELNPDEHRWYIVSTNVYECEDGYVGVRGVSSLKSESIFWEDVEVICSACEYEEYSTISYRPKN